MPSQLNKSLLLALLALLLFSPMFVIQRAGPVDFWWWMSINLVVLTSLSLISDRFFRADIQQDFSNDLLKKVSIGLISAVFLYLVFFIGNYLSRRWFGFASQGIEDVYKFKGDTSPIRIAILMILLIGPGEEIFWRGFLQRNISSKWGKWTGYAVTLALYTFVHLFTMNLMLILAAFICGLFWGWLYLKYKSVMVNVISHTIWDIVVFLVLPFGQ